jgi:hypothetical protein
MRARVEAGANGRIKYYHMLDRDLDGYVTKTDLLESAEYARSRRPACAQPCCSAARLAAAAAAVPDLCLNQCAPCQHGLVRSSRASPFSRARAQPGA